MREEKKGACGRLKEKGRRGKRRYIRDHEQNTFIRSVIIARRSRLHRAIPKNQVDDQVRTHLRHSKTKKGKVSQGNAVVRFQRQKDRWGAQRASDKTRENSKGPTYQENAAPAPCRRGPYSRIFARVPYSIPKKIRPNIERLKAVYYEDRCAHGSEDNTQGESFGSP